MTKLFTLIVGAVVGVATWFLLFVILGTGLGTALIAGGVILAAGVLGAGMIDASEKGAILDAPLTSTGLLAGVAAFVVLEVVLSAPMWVGVMTGLAVIGLYDIARVIVSPVRASEAPRAHREADSPVGARNGHDQHQREPVGAR